MNAYQRTLEALNRLELFGIRLGLENMRAACTTLEDPQLRYPVLHIAGTNGKGTVVAALESLARESGHRAGAYTSPHLVDFRERIRFDGEPISESALVERWTEVRDLVVDREMTYFEAATLMAFREFTERRVDVGIIEVGLGGRLDATNVVLPTASIITSIDLDHERHLGQDRVAIAAEKAGIAKPGRPIFVAPVDDRVREVIVRTADAQGSVARFADREIECRVTRVERTGTRFDLRVGEATIDDAWIPVAGPHLAANAALAVWVWTKTMDTRMSPEAIRAALARIRVPGRAQWARWDDLDVLFDVAHNRAATDRLVRTIDRITDAHPAVVAGILSDKAWPEMIERLLDIAAECRVCSLETAPPGRRLEPDTVIGRFGDRVIGSPSVADALDEARHTVTRGDAPFILVTGSFYSVGEALVTTRLAQEGRPYHPEFAGPTVSSALST